jgi:hypothetical protein
VTPCDRTERAVATSINHKKTPKGKKSKNVH